VKVIVLDVFVATMVKLQHFVVSEPDKVRHRQGQLFSKSQHRLRQASLYSWHTITSALRHN